MLVSPSGIDTFDSCQRKWAWRTINKIQGEGNPYAEFGTAVHAILESYLKAGVLPDRTTAEGECAFAFLHELPPPGTPGLLIEQHMSFPPFHGIPDVFEPGIVHDHKTCGTHRYALASLKDNTQAALYASWNFRTYGTPTVELRWNYVTRSKPKLLPVHQVVTPQDIAPTIARASATAARMRAVTAKTALELPPNPLVCEQYGGCPYKKLCDLSPQDKLTALLAQEDNMTNAFTPESFLTQVAAQVGAAPPPPPPPPGPLGNPWDDRARYPHQTDTHWHDGTDWRDKRAAPSPPPPPPPPAPIAINPPPVSTAPIAPPPAPPVVEPKRRGRPPKVTAAEGGGWQVNVANALRDLADAVEGIP